MTAVAGAGIKIMDDSLIPFQPAIDEPSNILPSLKKPSSTSRVGMVTCCSLPIVSVKRRSANFAAFSLINFRTSAGVMSYLVHRSEFEYALQGNPGLVVDESRLCCVRPRERTHEGRLGGLVVARLETQLETLDWRIAECDRAFLQRLRNAGAGNEAVLVVEVLEPQ